MDRYIYMRTTTNPEDIRTWGPERTLTGQENTTYANPIRPDHENNRLYLFNREVAWHPSVTSASITTGSSANNVRPILPWAANGQRNPRRMLFWMHGGYVHYTNYSTGIKYLFLDPPVSVHRRSAHRPPQGETPGSAPGYTLLGRYEPFGNRCLFRFP